MRLSPGLLCTMPHVSANDLLLSPRPSIGTKMTKPKNKQPKSTKPKSKKPKSKKPKSSPNQKRNSGGSGRGGGGQGRGGHGGGGNGSGLGGPTGNLRTGRPVYRSIYKVDLEIQQWAYTENDRCYGQSSLSGPPHFSKMPRNSSGFPRASIPDYESGISAENPKLLPCR